MERIGVQMHGVTLTLEVDHPPLAAYAREHLDGLVQAPPPLSDLLVRCFWSRGPWDPASNPFQTNGSLNVIGKRMLGNSEELIWLDTVRRKGLQLRFQRRPDQWIFEVACRFGPKLEKLQEFPEYEFKNYFSLMSYLVYYPLIWYLEQFRGWTVLHASALAGRHGGVIIAGLGGVGKTTTCVALMQQAGMDLISENLLLTDGKHVYACYEPIRLDAGSLAMLGESPQGLIPMAFPDGLKEKWLFHLKTHALPAKIRPAALFLPTFSPRRYVRLLPAEIAAEKIIAMNRLTRELDDYGWYAAAPHLLWPRPERSGQPHVVLHRLTKRARCFELGIDRSAGVGAVVQDVLGSLRC